MKTLLTIFVNQIVLHLSRPRRPQSCGIALALRYQAALEKFIRRDQRTQRLVAARDEQRLASRTQAPGHSGTCSKENRLPGLPHAGGLLNVV